MKELLIGSNEAGQRLDKYLGKYMKEAPRSFLYKMLRKKNITLNGKKATGNEILSVKDVVRLYLSDETISKFSSDKKDFYNRGKYTEPDIIYEDNSTIFINKPVGMLSQKAVQKDVSLVENLIEYLIRTRQITKEELRTFHPSVCNRLDRNTSGIVAAGKTFPALQQLSKMFHDRTLKKYYLCLVKGNVKKPACIDGYLVKNRLNNRVSISSVPDENSSRIITEYRPLNSADDTTLLEVHLITGKTHQIRAHLSSSGHPVIGDYKYGDTAINQKYKTKFGLESQLLHSARLCFPTCSGELAALSEKELTAPLPDLFSKICSETGVIS